MEEDKNTEVAIHVVLGHYLQKPEDIAIEQSKNATRAQEVAVGYELDEIDET
jgi:hypothetical protein